MQGPRTLVAALGLALLVAAHGEVGAQEAAGTTGSTVGGAALGLYSGGMLGLVGSLLPCDRTLLGPGCSGVSTAVSGAFGMVLGGVIGAHDRREVDERLENAGYGAAVGGLVGLVLQQAVRQYGPLDALLVAGVGFAIGAAPDGALLGAGVGASVGGITWAVAPRSGLQDFVMSTVVGASLGGLLDWALGAAEASGGGSSPFVASVSVQVP